MTSAILVDDNEDIVSSLSELLELNEINVVGKGYDGLQGVELFEKLDPDVVLLDLLMPQYDGLYALRKIREKDPTAHVIIITGGYSPSVEEEIKSLKPTKILFKPIDVNNLIKSISEISINRTPFKIQYKFKNDPKPYTCILTSEQYLNFKKLPAVVECNIIKKDEKNILSYKNEMQIALNLAAKNDITHIQKLSQSL